MRQDGYQYGGIHTETRTRGGYAMSQNAVTQQLAKPVEAQDHIQGPDTATVTLVEYGDYEDPNTAAAAAVVEEVRRRMGERMRYAFRHFPRHDVHPHAESAAEAAEAAAAQNMFWEMHNHLLEHQDRLDDNSLTNYAELIGLDVDRFEQDMADHHFARRVMSDVRSGMFSAVTDTPAFFINGMRYQGPIEVEGMVEAVQKAGPVDWQI